MPILRGWYLLLPIVALSLTRELWAPDEPRYAQVAREAFEGRSWLVLHLNGSLYPDKPPLLYWLAGLFGAVSGWSEFAMRVPSIAATAGSAWLTSRLARRFWGDLEARWAPTMYLGTAMLLEIGGRLQIDPLLAFLCLASLLLATEPVRDVSRARRDLWLSGASLGLAALAKGPVAWLHVALPLIAWRFLPSRARGTLPRSASGWTGFALLAVVPVVLWAAAASTVEPSLLEPLFYGQHLGRVSEGTQHAGPPWYHVVHLPYLVMPWTPLFVLAILNIYQSYRGRAASDRGMASAITWLSPIVLFFSVIAPKRDLYILPLYPAIALLCAREMARAERTGRLSKWVALPSPVIFCVGGAALMLVPWCLDAFAQYRVGGTLAGASLLAGGALALRAERRSNWRAWADSIGVGSAVAVITLAFALVPIVNPVKSARELGLYLATRPEKPRSIACWGVQPEGYRFYGGVPTVKEDIEVALDREGDQFLALVQRKYFEHLAPQVRARVQVLDSRTVGSRDVVVLGARSLASVQGSPPPSRRSPGLAVRAD